MKCEDHNLKHSFPQTNSLGNGNPGEADPWDRCYTLLASHALLCKTNVKEKGEDSLLKRGRYKLISKLSFLKTSADFKLQVSNDVEEFESRTSRMNPTCSSYSGTELLLKGSKSLTEEAENTKNYRSNQHVGIASWCERRVL